MSSRLVHGIWAEVARNLKEEFKAWQHIIRYDWFVFTLFGLVVLGLVLKFSPLPPDEVYMGVGQVGSNYPRLANEFAKYFERYGITIKKVPSKGLSEDLSRIVSEKSPVDSAFYIAGTGIPEKMASVVSLGSIQYSPVWIIYRGPERKGIEGLKKLLHQRLAVGAEQSSSHAIAGKIAQLHGIDLHPSQRVFAIPHTDAVAKLKAGEVDAAIIVDSIDSSLISPFLCNEQFHVFNFSEAEAYTKRLPFLHVLSIPRGALNLNQQCPNKEIRLLGTSLNLLIQRDTHPVVQWIFLKAIRSINNTRTPFFSEPGFFPVYLDREVALSKVAKTYYDKGLPLLSAYAPLWLADFIDRIWFYVVAIITLFIPALRFLYTSRAFYGQQVLRNAYRELLFIDQAIPTMATPDDGEDLLRRLDALGSSINQTWFSSESLKDFFSLRPRIRNVREEIKQRISQLSNEAAQ